MKDWCMKYPGYLILALWIIVGGIKDITAAFKGSKIEPLIYIGLSK